jgi:hypothetical protein
MEQHAINDAEWKNPSNWTGPKWLLVYFSKRDSRAWVPKQVRRSAGPSTWVKPAGVRRFLGIVAGITAAMLGTGCLDRQRLLST